MGWIKNRIDAEYRKHHKNLDWSMLAETKIIATIKEELLNSGQYPCGFINSVDNLCDRVPREQIEELLNKRSKK